MSQVTASFVSLLCSSSYISQMVKNGWIHALDLAPFLHSMLFLKQSYLSGLGSGTESTLVCVSSWAQIRDLSCVNHFIVKPQIIENKRVFIGISKQGTLKRLYIYIFEVHVHRSFPCTRHIYIWWSNSSHTFASILESLQPLLPLCYLQVNKWNLQTQIFLTVHVSIVTGEKLQN